MARKDPKDLTVEEKLKAVLFPSVETEEESE